MIRADSHERRLAMSHPGPLIAWTAHILVIGHYHAGGDTGLEGVKDNRARGVTSNAVEVCACRVSRSRQMAALRAKSRGPVQGRQWSYERVDKEWTSDEHLPAEHLRVTVEQDLR
jgi:hypothetical protein